MARDPGELGDRIGKALGWTGPVFCISALTGEGTQELVWQLQDWLDADRDRSRQAQDQAQAGYVDPDPRFYDQRHTISRPPDEQSPTALQPSPPHRHHPLDNWWNQDNVLYNPPNLSR